MIKEFYKKITPVFLRRMAWWFLNTMLNQKKNIVSQVKLLSWKLVNYENRKKYGLLKVKRYSDVDYNSLKENELFSIAKHEAHRIEKAYYSGYMNTNKKGNYVDSHNNLGQIISILKSNFENHSRADFQWLMKIYSHFNNMEEFKKDGMGNIPNFQFNKITEFESIVKTRRSTRTWADNNFSKDELINIGKALINCAKWAPCSGNRQPWYFKLLVDPNEKELLRGIKENHCITAPLVIFMGVHKSSYGAIGNKEQGMYIDGGAAAMQLIMASHYSGLGSCWNHFAYDFVYSRPKNLPIFKNFYKQLAISEDIEPIALIAFGNPAFVSPAPERPPVDAICDC